ncbi:MAG: hypothetical protein IPN76_26920 [Saprospiraceae bacterium]|nr:hypothetical protein [Saprospiraceae bacterium]
MGYIDNIRDDDYVKEEWTLTSNRHGSLPVVENLERYFEYHGMYCAAMELFENEPLLKTEPNSWDSWDYWLESDGLALKNFWLSDLREPIPLDKKFWNSDFNRFDEAWRNGVNDKDYDSVLGISDDSEMNCITVNGGYTRYFGENYESVSINSALVTPKTSNALLRALQTAKDSHDYRIPSEDDELQIKKENFQLIGWLKEVTSDYEGLDKNDPFAGEISKSYTIFGREVENHFKITYNEEFKCAFYNDEKISTFQNWSDEKRHRYDNAIRSSGHLFEVKPKFLLEFLQKRQMYLIIECTISRQIKERNYNFEKPIRRNDSKLYLIKSNGEVKTIRGRNYKIG